MYINLNETRLKLLKVLKGTTFENNTYIAGGSVRDSLLHRAIDDVDIAVHLPDGGIRLAEYLTQIRYSYNPVIYKQFGTALVRFYGIKLELVMTRKESYRSHSRHPKVEFGSLKEDVVRRDFTVNSLLMRVSDGEILDLTGIGLADLQAGIIRTTNEPELIFTEDPLRLLRAIRFAVTLKFNIEPVTYAALKLRAGELKYISPERIGGEFYRVMESAAWFRGLLLFSATGLLALISNKISPGFYQILEKNRTQIIRMPQPLWAELAIEGRYWLLFPSPAVMQTALKELKLPAELIKKAVFFAQGMERLIEFLPCSGAEQQLNSFVYEHRNQIDKLLTQYQLIHQSLDTEGLPSLTAEFIQSMMDKAECMTKNIFRLTGRDLISTFCLKSSPLVGELLSEALEYWFAHPEAGKKQLLAALGNMHPELKMNR
jgi:tRNA nucleotidyltransferase/poly(A) polymerase